MLIKFTPPAFRIDACVGGDGLPKKFFQRYGRKKRHLLLNYHYTISVVQASLSSFTNN